MFWFERIQEMIQPLEDELRAWRYPFSQRFLPSLPILGFLPAEAYF